MKKEAVKFVLAIVFCVFFAAGSQAATNYYWNDPNVVGNYSWNNAAGNWGSSTYVPILAYPTTGDTAYIYKAKECIIGTDMVGVAKALAANVYVGGLASTNAFLTIKGEASFAASLRLGYAAVADSKGTVRIDTGAVVTVPTLVVGSTGTSTYTSIGDCNLMGTLNVTSAIVIGTNVAYGNGVMTVNGGTLNYTGTGNTFILSNLASSKGKLTVNNGAVVNIASTIYIGKVGIGELIINSGGKVKTTAIAPLQVGSAVGSTGSLTMNGGVLEVGNILHIGTNSANTNFMQLNNDANVMAGNTLQIAYSSATSVGRLTIAGTAKMRVASHIYMGFATAGTGAATIELQGGTLTGMATLVINSGSALNKINITGGTLILPISQFANVNTYIGNGRIYTGYGSSRCIKVQTTATQVIVTADINLLKAAWNPVPATGGTVTPCADANIVLQWSPGLNAISHDVYGGTNYNDVNDANTSTAGIFQGNQLLGDETFELNPSAIPVGQTVYWRIDEVGSTTTTKGNVWSFTREALIESFESYITDANLQAVWPNGILQIGSTTSPAGGRGLGTKSMEIDYSTAGAPYETKVTQTFACPRDFTAGAAKSLVLYFHGAKLNVSEVVFVQLSDGTNSARVYYNSGDPNRITEYWNYWQFFGVPLSDFAGVNLANITSISIGAGDGIAGGGGIGKLYIDDIKVYPLTCFAGKSALTGDIVLTNSFPYSGGDTETTMTNCSIDFFDFAGLAMDWQRSGSTVTAVAPSDSNLVLRYEFEDGGGTTAADSSGKGNNGDINWEGDWRTPGHSGDALFHNGGVFVTLPAAAFSTVTNEITISVWMRNPAGVGGTGSPIPNNAHFFDAGKGTSSYVFTIYLGWKPEGDNASYGTVPFLTNYDTPGEQDFVAVSYPSPDKYYGIEPGGTLRWVHYAFVKNVTTGVQQIYVDGELVAEGRNMFRSIAGITKATLGTATWVARPFFGESDDLRIYDKALSQAEIVSLAGKASVVQPLITSADINKDNVVDFKDLSVIFDSWASISLWP
ncbi:MAG: LamG-like jellyroll fold domain-containing protein [Phycisphaerae bacterium]|jgi:T5SS/PEP-CTERM-associated repeat protein